MTYIIIIESMARDKIPSYFPFFWGWGGELKYKIKCVYNH